jgi:16S rRNA (guanine1207-N2)-methyltransferase
MALSAGTASEAALEALFVPFATGALRWPDDGRLLMLRARDGFALRERRRPGWVMQQSFKPAADALARSGFEVVAEPPSERFRVVMVLPTRQREETRALFAQALACAGSDGIVVAAVPNSEGAKTAEGDLASLAGLGGQLSKHKCRVFWTRPGSVPDPMLHEAWLALDAPTTIEDGRFLSRRGLFAWDRIDIASALLAAALPVDLQGRLADLGAGFGFLACAAIERCPGIVAADLYEAEGRALAPATANLAAAVARVGRDVDTSVQWADVTHGIAPGYDVIVSNPPFHQGRADQPELGRAFIAAAARGLAPAGRFWMVANRHLAYEAALDAAFARVHRVVDSDGFKVIEAQEPRR